MSNQKSRRLAWGEDFPLPLLHSRIVAKPQHEAHEARMCEHDRHKFQRFLRTGSIGHVLYMHTRDTRLVARWFADNEERPFARDLPVRYSLKDRELIYTLVKHEWDKNPITAMLASKGGVDTIIEQEFIPINQVVGPVSMSYHTHTRLQMKIVLFGDVHVLPHIEPGALYTSTVGEFVRVNVEHSAQVIDVFNEIGFDLPDALPERRTWLDDLDARFMRESGRKGFRNMRYHRVDIRGGRPFETHDDIFLRFHNWALHGYMDPGTISQHGVNPDLLYEILQTRGDLIYHIEVITREITGGNQELGSIEDEELFSTITDFFLKKQFTRISRFYESLQAVLGEGPVTLNSVTALLRGEIPMTPVQRSTLRLATVRVASLVMDVYTIGRIFRTTRESKLEMLRKRHAVVVFAGDAHIELYRQCLGLLGFSQLALQKNTEHRVIDTSVIPQPL
jgi:hypothetical protein